MDMHTSEVCGFRHDSERRAGWGTYDKVITISQRKCTLGDLDATIP